MGKSRWGAYVALFFTWVAMMADTSALAAKRDHIGQNQKVLVVCTKYSNLSTSRLSKASDWVNLLQNETGAFYKSATFNKTTFKFETPSSLPGDGWLDLGYSNADYEFAKTGQDAIDLIDSYVDFNDYDRVLVITAGTDPGGVGNGPYWWKVDEGGETVFVENGKSVDKRAMTLSICNEWLEHGYGVTSYDIGASLMGHELGHQIQTRTHYHDMRWHPGISRDSISPWDIMGISPCFNHFIGWCKADRGWIPSWPNETAKIKIYGPPSNSDIDQTETLTPQETNSSGIKLIGIPLTALGNPPRFLGYVVENRQRLKGDGQIPEEGVLITLVDESPNIYLGRRCIVMDDPDHPGKLNEAALEVGDVFSDATYNLSVSVIGQSGDDYHVRVQYKQPPHHKPDLMINPWNAPPWETSDIWIDSEKNGWGTYKYKDQVTGEPIGNGDDAWVDHTNRVWIRVHNIGQGNASNVRVKMYINDPPGMGAAGPVWKYGGTIFFPWIAANGVAEDWLKWKPAVGKHTCIKAEILELPGELSNTNNIAQENVAHFETSSASPFEPVRLTIHVHNPFEKEETPVFYHVTDIPEGWAVELEPPQTILAPSGLDSVTFRIYPSGTTDRPLSDELVDLYQPGYVGRPKIEARVPYADTHIPIGGVDVWTHLVRRTRLDFVCDPAGSEVHISGRLESALANSRIAIEFTDRSSREVRYLTTDLSGNYVGKIELPKKGPWRAQAFFAGDEMSASTESDTCRFELEE